MSVKGRIARKPWWVRKRCSCPHCGFVFQHESEDKHIKSMGTFKCPQCKTEMSFVDFWNFHHDKYSKSSDLSEEQEFNEYE